MGKPHSLLYGISDKEIARILRVSLKTAHRYKAGHSVPCYSALLHIEGDLGGWDEAWRGWRLQHGKLVSPEGIEATPGDVLSIPFMIAQVAVYQAEYRRMRAEADDFEDQPTPADWDVQIA